MHLEVLQRSSEQFCLSKTSLTIADPENEESDFKVNVTL